MVLHHFQRSFGGCSPRTATLLFGWLHFIACSIPIMAMMTSAVTVPGKFLDETPNQSMKTTTKSMDKEQSSCLKFLKNHVQSTIELINDLEKTKDQELIVDDKSSSWTLMEDNEPTSKIYWNDYKALMNKLESLSPKYFNDYIRRKESINEHESSSRNYLEDYESSSMKYWDDNKPIRDEVESSSSKYFKDRTKTKRSINDDDDDDESSARRFLKDREWYEHRGRMHELGTSSPNCFNHHDGPINDDDESPFVVSYSAGIYSSQGNLWILMMFLLSLIMHAVLIVG